MIQKQSIAIGFAKGLDTKTDPKQVQIGNFLSLKNSVFTEAGLLKKRNGFPKLTTLPDDGSAYLTTFNNNLTAIGTSLNAFIEGNGEWVNKGKIQPIDLSVLPVVRSDLSQVQCDSVISPSGVACVVYTELNNTTLTYKYAVYDSVTGQKVVSNQTILVSSGVVTGAPRVFLLVGYFLIVFTNTIGGVHHLQYIAVSVSNPTTVTSNADLAANYSPTNALSWDGVILGNSFYFAYYTTSGGNAVKINVLEASLILGSPTSYSNVATIISVTADVSVPSNPVIYVSFYDSGSSTGYVVAVNSELQKVMLATEIITTGTIFSITASAQNGIVTVFYEEAYQYVYDTALVSNFIQDSAVQLPATLTTGTILSSSLVSRSVGLASKSFILGGTIYLLAEYASLLQSTYFLMDSSGNIYSRFAYGNGGASLVTTNGCLPYGLPQAQVIGSTVTIPYLFKDLIESQNTLGLVESIGPAGKSNVYSQTGVNVVSLNFTSDKLTSSETGQNLNLTGGLLWAYDGSQVNEQGFNVFPDNVEAVGNIASGSMTPGPYYYQVTYEWTDAQGNIFRSSPSIPVESILTTDTSTLVDIPTLRLSYKTGVKIQIYRWSAAQQIYYQVTSITAPTLNDPTVDYISYLDTQSDAQILGNNIIYTNGGTVGNDAGPACSAMTIFDNRLWLVDAEDQNLLFFSKQVIESTPVEMSAQFTLFISPTIGAQGPTGPITALAPLDSNLIIFKKDAIYYLTGSGPDNTGASNQYTQPVFITSTVGCIKQNSIVITNDGLMFQSDKGIWLLRGNQLSVSYVGAPVEAFNSQSVASSQIIPGTTQARFVLTAGETLMWDYFFQQWGEFDGIEAISATLYNGKHTLLTAQGLVLQEQEGQYLDNGNPVLLSFVTGNIQLSGISGYQRIYEIQMLGQYFSPHFLNVKLGYNFGPLSEYAAIQPDNLTDIYGSDDFYGQTTPYGGIGDLEQWRIQPATQKCQTFQISLEEIFDPSFSTIPGAGFTLSAMTCTIGVNRSYRPVKATNTVGTQ